MNLTITARSRPEQHFVGYPVSARLSEFGVANALIPRVFGWLAEHQIPPASGPMYVYHRIGPLTDPIDLSVTVPVSGPVATSAGLVAGSLPAGEYVIGRYVGRPDGVGAAQRAVESWASAQGHRLAVAIEAGVGVWAGRADVFLTDPSEQPDESKWVTELLYLVRQHNRADLGRRQA